MGVVSPVCSSSLKGNDLEERGTTATQRSVQVLSFNRPGFTASRRVLDGPKRKRSWARVFICVIKGGNCLDSRG